MAKEIIITAEAPTLTKVTLVGESYDVRPMKGSLGIALAQRFSGGKDLKPDQVSKGVDTLVATMFGKEKNKIMKRLADPEDLLDYPHIFQLMEALTEESTGNPTTS